MIAYLIVFIALLIAELIYFRIANHFNIIDKPNERSSHKVIVLRGGGIVFIISLLVYFFTHQLQYPIFVLGLVTIAGISFADDIKTRSTTLRLLLQLLAVAFLLYQLHEMHLFTFNWIITIIAFIFIAFFINAYNFMDGINGITTGYSFTVLATLFYLNYQLKIFDNDAIIYLSIGNLVFFIFNFRTKAKCFAGDVGSIGIAFALLFFTVGIILKTGSPIFILLFAVYGVDSGLTIFQRLLKKENIFKAHRQHLYQYLANERRLPQLFVSAVYMLIQAIICFGVCLFWQAKFISQSVFAAIVLACLALMYVLAKRAILRTK